MVTNYEKHVFLIHEATTHEDFAALAAREQWTLAAESKGDGKITGFAQAWIARDGETEVHYVDEPGLGGIRFLVLKGPGLNDVIDLIGPALQLRTSINVVRHAREAQTDAEKRIAAYELAVVFPTFNPQAMEILKSYYSGGSDEVRTRVVQALTYRAWPEGIEFIGEIARVDDYPELRKYAADMAKLCRERNNGK